MKETEELIVFMESKAQELKRIREKNKERTEWEDVIETRLEKIEKGIEQIRLAIVGD